MARLQAIAAGRLLEDGVTACLVAEPATTKVSDTPVETVQVTVWVPAADVAGGLLPFFADAAVLAVAAATPHFAAMADDRALAAFLDASARSGAA